jgi:hypothetical protein
MIKRFIDANIEHVVFYNPDADEVFSIMEDFDDVQQAYAAYYDYKK